MLFALFLPGSATGEPLPQGLPPLHLTQPDPDFYPRFYSVAQASDGMLFVAGEEGVHAFNGRDWTTTELPNRRLVRHLKHDGGRRLYVGGYGQFGFIELDARGEPAFTDLTPPLESLIDADNFADVWDIVITPDGVFFRALFHLFRFEPASGQVDVWHHPGRLGGMLWHEDALWLQFRGSGLRRLDGDRFQPVPGGEALTEHIVAFLPLPDGGLLTMGRDGQWRRLHNGRLRDWPAPASLPGPETFEAYLTLADGSFALGAPDGRLHLLDPVTREHRAFQVAFDFISKLAPAVDGGILIQTDRATTHLFWPSPWTRLAQETGLVGQVNDLALWQDRWHAITNAGVQRLERGRFEPTGWSAFETWDWLTLDSGRALLADSFNLLEITADAGPRVLFEDLYPRLLVRSRFDPDQVLIGTELGLAVASRADPGWQLVYRQKGFTGLVSSIVELDAQNLLLGIDGTGLVRLRVNEARSEILDRKVYGAEDGVDYGNLPQADLITASDGEILVSTRGGFYRYAETGLEAISLPGLEHPNGAEPLVRFERAPDGRLWAYRERLLWYQDERGTWQSANIAALEAGVIASLTFLPDGRVLVGDRGAILQYDAGVEADEPLPMSVRLRQVQMVAGDGRISRLPLDGRALSLPHDITSLRFDYALPNYRQPHLNRYRARMLGYESSFSDWSRTRRITYSRLRPGPKRFEVEARDHLGRVSRIEPFEFEVLQPWYGTAWARLLWIALALAVLAFGIRGLLRWRLARSETERQRLATMIEQRTADLEAANRKLENMANVDGLTGAANRRRLDVYLEEAWARASDRRGHLSVALIDVDHFKRFNDTRGHQAGDDALRTVVELLTESLRRSEDVVARYGGEEFMVVLPNADLERARDIVETLRLAIESSPLGITASVGVAATRPHDGPSLKALIRAADQALYRAKQNGRNRVEIGQPD